MEQLSRHIDGDLTAARRRALVLHLEGCPCCESFADSLRRTVVICRKGGKARLPPALRARARARIRALVEPGTSVARPGGRR
jgi:anti-sigma factor RsiW